VSAERDRKISSIPTPLNLADSQRLEALAEIRRDRSARPPHFPWTSAVGLVGPFLPGHLVTVGARSGNGKTTFLLNAFDALVEARYPAIYLTTETKSEEMHRLWASMRLGYKAGDVLENAWDRLPGGAADRMAERIEFQTTGAADVGLFVDLPVLDRDHVAAVLEEYAIRCGYGFVFIDHIHRWQARDVAQKTGEMTAAVQGLKATAVKFGLTVIVAAQVNRGQDQSPLSEFLPPTVSRLQQTSALEQESNVVLMLHRQRRKDVTVAQVKEVAMGQRDVRDLIEPGVMCCSIAKHRNRPANLGRTFRLQVRDSCALEDLDHAALVRLGLAPEYTNEGTAQEPEQDDLPF
jgi:replicative DNA helicase